MVAVTDYLIWLGEADSFNEEAISLNQRQLSDLYLAGVPVQLGFILTAEAMSLWLRHNELEPTITRLLLNTSLNDNRALAKTCQQIRHKIGHGGLPKRLAADLEIAYRRLADSSSHNPQFMLQPAIVGSPAFLPPLPNLPVTSLSSLRRALITLYQQFYQPKYLTSTTLQAIATHRLRVSCLVQPAESVYRSGRLILTSNTQTLTIQAIAGRPEPFQAGFIIPDQYQVDRDTMAVISRDVNRQDWQLTKLDQAGRHQRLPALEQTAPKLSDHDILSVAKIGLMVEQQIDFPCQIDWQLDDAGQVWVIGIKSLLGSEPLPTRLASEQPLLLTGKPLVAGRITAPIRLIHQAKDLNELPANNILVAVSPDLLTDIDFDQAGGLILESGQDHDRLIKAAHVHGLPVVVANQASHRLKDGLVVTLDGYTGMVSSGRLVNPAGINLPSTQTVQATGTKLYVALDHLSSLNQGAVAAADGVGLLSARTIWQQLGDHPRSRLKNGQSRSLAIQLANQLGEQAEKWQPRPVIYATHDLLTTDYRQLRQGSAHEPIETNPLLGYRGAQRLIREPDIFKIELEAIRQVRDEFGLTNLHLMIPFVRTAQEVAKINHLLVGSGLQPGRDFKLWLLCQVPASLRFVPELAKAGLIQGLCLDADSLTQLLLGVDQNNPDLAEEYTVADKGVQTALIEAIVVARSAALPVTVAGHSINHYPEALEGLIQAGITGLVISSTVVEDLRRLIASAEQRLVIDHILAETLN